MGVVKDKVPPRTELEAKVSYPGIDETCMSVSDLVGLVGIGTGESLLWLHGKTRTGCCVHNMDS